MKGKKKGKIECMHMADGQKGYAYGGRIYNEKQFSNLYAQGGVASGGVDDDVILGMFAGGPVEGDEKKKKVPFQKSSNYQEDVRDPKSSRYVTGYKNKKPLYGLQGSDPSVQDDMTNANIAGGGGLRNLQDEEAPQVITNPVATAGSGMDYVSTQFGNKENAQNQQNLNSSSQVVNTPKEGSMFSGSFSQAFGSARKSGLKSFTWNGKLYGTKLASDTQGADVEREGVISNSLDPEVRKGTIITAGRKQLYDKLYAGLPNAQENKVASNQQKPSPTSTPTKQDNTVVKKTLAMALKRKNPNNTAKK